MSISILNRGASGGLKPELTVIAPAGSTIDLLQNGVIVATYTLGSAETEHTFIVKVGTYTVRGTLVKVQSKEVVIDVVGQYAVEIDYKLWLYREGDEYEAVTGGWYISPMAGTTGTPIFTKESARLSIRCPQWSSADLKTHNKISTTGWSDFCVEYTVTNLSSSTYVYFGALADTSTTGTQVVAAGAIKIASPVKAKLLANTESDYILTIANTFSGYVYIHNVWLE